MRGFSFLARLYWEALIRLRPERADAHNRLGVLHKEAGRLDAAEAAYREALRRNPDHAGARNNLGVLHKEAGRLDEAEAAYHEALRCDPGFAPAHNNLGVLYKEAGRLDEAEAAYCEALSCNPRQADAHNNLGVIFKESGRLDEAEAAYREALRLRPGHADAHNNLGVVCKESERPQEAEAAYHAALRLRPDHANAHNNLGVLYKETGRLDEAEAAYRAALRLCPDHVDALYNLGVLYGDQEQQAEAESFYRATLRVRPEHADAAWNLSLILLSQGRYEEGWARYETRCNPNVQRPHDIPDLDPVWQGEDLTGKRIVVWLEQGFGDEIQFARFAPLLKERGCAQVILLCSPPLRELLRTLDGVDVVLAKEDPLPAYDFWIFVMSLPWRLGMRLDTIPARLPYLAADPVRLERWRERLPEGALRVGLVWKGSASHRNDAHRSMPGLSTLAPLWSAPGVVFVSLQKGQGEDEAAHPPPGQALTHLGSEIRDFADSAALVAQLDLVICVDTAIAHVAGALGKPCWVLLPKRGTDWRWLHERSDSLWYPATLRLFRQRDGWEGVVGEAAAALRAWAGSRMRS
ncbi:MAG: tetratricopeptide repeat protein [Betaproteobacteria bacterium]|nr:tetratricopeptide repeat protein [Betaproteobacteria bacterium]